MDNIDRIMKEADRLGFGVSYGKYRAAYPDGSKAVVSAAAQEPLECEDDLRMCKICGKEFLPTHGNQACCSAECKAEAEKKRQREWYRKKHEIPDTAVCAICGVQFKPKSPRNKCCSKECSRKNKQQSSARWYAAHKKGAC